MNKPTQPIPDGYHTLTPHLVVNDASRAIEFYQKAFGAEECFRMPAPDGKIIHADLQIGNSHLFLVDEMPAMDSKGPHLTGGAPVTIHMYVKDVDTTFENAIAAGAQVRMPVADMFWGDRYGVVIDPFGHSWSLATHKEDPSPAEIAKRAEAAFAAGARG